MNYLKKLFLLIFIILSMIGISSYYTKNYLEKTSKTLETHIAEVERNAISKNWTAAHAELEAFKKNWLATESKWSILLDHFEIDNIDTSLSRLEKYTEAKDPSPAMAEAAALKQLIKHIPEKESLNIMNIF